MEDERRTESWTVKLTPSVATQLIDRAFVAGISRNALLNRIIERWLAEQRKRDGGLE